jgi:hypothetical protein
MPIANHRLAVDLDGVDLQRFHDAIAVLHEQLVPRLVALHPDQRRGLPKMGDKTVAFVRKTLDYTQLHPHMRAPYVDMEQFAKRFETVESLLALRRPLNQVMGLLEDSVLLAGSDALKAALACYSVIKGAARLNVPGAAVVANDLGQRFPGRSRSNGVDAKVEGAGAPSAADAAPKSDAGA